MARRRSKKKSRKKLKRSAPSQESVSRQGRKWSINSDLFHRTDCPAVARISKANVRSGVAPDSLKPHDCVIASKIETTASDSGVSEPVGLSGFVPERRSEAGVADAPAGVAPAIAPTQSSCADPVNPYCRCNPCKCPPPCTCGLRKTETQCQTQWDSNEQLLRYVTTAIYRPDPAKILNAKAHHDDSSSVASGGQAPVRHAVVAIDHALSQSGNSQIRHAMVKRNVSHDMGGADDVHAHAASIRKAEHHGNHIELRTMYEVVINGEPLNVHIGVLNDGSVHCHSIPNYSSASGIDLIKTIIDAFPDDYPPRD